jgi:hypothetical protein
VQEGAAQRPSDEHPEADHRVTDAEIAKNATNAWPTAFFASPTGHRANAQAGYTIAAAVATLIVGAGLLTSADEAPLWVQIPLLSSTGPAVSPSRRDR